MDAINDHFEMKVDSGALTGISHNADYITTLYSGSRSYPEAGQMAVKGFDAAAVIDDHSIAVSIVTFRQDQNAIFRSYNGPSGNAIASDIKALVPA